MHRLCVCVCPIGGFIVSSQTGIHDAELQDFTVQVIQQIIRGVIKKSMPPESRDQNPSKIPCSHVIDQSSPPNTNHTNPKKNKTKQWISQVFPTPSVLIVFRKHPYP